MNQIDEEAIYDLFQFQNKTKQEGKYFYNLTIFYHK